MRIKRLALSVAAIVALNASAFGSFKVEKIDFEGLNHITTQTADDYLPIKVGDLVDAQISQQVIQKLFATGFFSDIKLYQEGSTLLIDVKERPTIAKINITGNEKIKTDAITKVLESIGIQAGNLLNPTLLSQMIQSLKSQYYMLGKYSVRVTPKLIALPRNRVEIDVNIAEGTYTTLQNINIVGNHAFSQKTLLKQLTLSTPNWLSFITDDDVYSAEKLSKSLQGLSDFYLDRGYLDFHVTSTQVALGPFKEKSYLTINVTEGKPYTFEGASFNGTEVLPESQLRKMLTLQKGEVFSKASIMATSKAITSALGDKGYAFARVDPVPQLDKKKHTVTIQFNIEPGRRVYIHHINFVGNTVTEDKALRHYLTYQEAGLYNKKQLSYSLMALQRLPYIQSAQQKVVPVAAGGDKVDINYQLTERSASSIQASIGYSELDKLIFGIGLGIPNVFGTGKSFSINAQLSKPYKSLTLSYTNPYFTQSGIQQTVSAYLSNVDNSQRSLINFTTNSVGATLSYAIPLNATDFFHIGGGVDNTRLLQPQNNTSLTVYDFVKDYGDNYNTLSLSLGWSHNSTNNAFFPTQGITASVNGQVATPLSKFTWYKLMSSITWYQALNHIFTLSLGGDVNYGNGYGSTHHLPFFDNFYGGGWGSVRGFAQSTLGPLDQQCSSISSSGTCSGPTQGQPLGGNLEVDGSLNLTFPVPFEADNPNLRMGAFLDMGNVYDTYHNPTIWDSSNQPHYPTFKNLRYAVGLSLQWISPIGPLAFSIAKPLNAKSGDQTQFFQFTLGTTF